MIHSVSKQKTVMSSNQTHKNINTQSQQKTSIHKNYSTTMKENYNQAIYKFILHIDQRSN